MAAVAGGVRIPAGVEIDTIWITEATLGYVLSQALPRCVSFLCKQGASFLIWCSKACSTASIAAMMRFGFSMCLEDDCRRDWSEIGIEVPVEGHALR